MQNTYPDASRALVVEEDAVFWRKVILRLVLLAAMVSAMSHASAAFAAETPQFVTKAPATKPATKVEEMAALPRGLDVDVRVTCTSKHVAFSFQNDGNDWPKRAKIAILKDGNGDILTQRSLNMKQGQKVTFRVKTRGLKMGDLGLDIRADWVPLGDQRQITVNCDLLS